MESIYQVFNFIVSVLQTIIEGINGLTSILGSLVNLILSISKIIPEPLYSCFMTFLALYSTIFIYKIIRQG